MSGKSLNVKCTASRRHKEWALIFSCSILVCKQSADTALATQILLAIDMLTQAENYNVDLSVFVSVLFYLSFSTKSQCILDIKTRFATLNRFYSTSFLIIKYSVVCIL